VWSNPTHINHTTTTNNNSTTSPIRCCMPTRPPARSVPSEGVPGDGRTTTPPRGGRAGAVGHELLPVADKTVASIPDDEFNSKYKNAPDHAEGKATMQVCEATRSKIQGMPNILPEAELISDAHQPPAQDLAAIVQQQPVGMRGAVRGASNPERMTPEAVWNDNRDHFKQDKTTPEQLADEKRVGKFVHSSAQQFEQATGAVKNDLANRPHLKTEDWQPPLGSAEVCIPPLSPPPPALDLCCVATNP
jgi:hypothetical protein